MAKISKVNIAEVWGFDELFPILQDAFRVLYVSYFNLSIAKKIILIKDLSKVIGIWKILLQMI